MPTDVSSSTARLPERLEHQHVFELPDTVQSWDDDYYPPVALRYYDSAVSNMLKWMGAKPGDEVLDAGCGPGVHSIRAAQHGCRVHAIDLSTTMLEQARQRVAKAGFADKVRFEPADLTKLHLPDNSVDFAFSWGVIIHIPKEGAEHAFANLARVMKPGGKLALYLTNRTALDNRIETVLRGIVRKPLDRQRYNLGDGVFYDMHGEKLWLWRFDHHALVDFMDKHGMTLTKRCCGEYSEFQRRVPKIVRPAFLHANNAAYAMKLPAHFSYCNLWVFEKRDQQ